MKMPVRIRCTQTYPDLHGGVLPLPSTPTNYGPHKLYIAHFVTGSPSSNSLWRKLCSNSANDSPLLASRARYNDVIIKSLEPSSANQFVAITADAPASRKAL